MSTASYKRKHYHQIILLYPVEEYGDLVDASRAAGESVGEYLKQSAELRMTAEGRAPRKWYLLEDCTRSQGRVYHTALKSRTKAGAIQEGVAIWRSLTPYDQSQREECQVFRARLDQWGDPDFDSSTDFVDIIEASQD